MFQPSSRLATPALTNRRSLVWVPVKLIVSQPDWSKMARSAGPGGPAGVQFPGALKTPLPPFQV